MQIFVEKANVVFGEVTTYDLGAYDYWEGPWVGEFQGPNPLNTICGSQGYRDLVHETMVPTYYYEGVFSGYKASCVFGQRYVRFASRYTDELWDWRFGWKSVNTPNNDWVEVGIIDA